MYTLFDNLSLAGVLPWYDRRDQCYETAIALDPRLVEVYGNRAVLHLLSQHALGNHDQASADWRRHRQVMAERGEASEHADEIAELEGGRSEDPATDTRR